ncbi:peptide chain release factor N(5)-glutamine methyltransferase [Chlorobium phaeovibrioides]|uniref:Release factor glutamine methyltransferase n=1 Tax=Chlorobium phaeovibrioides TaxID=1094 RepID=A0A3S0NAX4_CHLPH|nr:peptide chain release factor N(5)-glutamine methyltransferase [Chlorobium phaeovibrioides]RTY38848.1 peptide chain release factor N(5)-glutamine methyltransferase [Chlorobium phaeovibrioides]
MLMEQVREWQVVDLLKTTEEFFSSKGVDEARIGAEMLLSQVLGLKRIELYLNYQRPVYPDELERFRGLCRQRLEGRPVQYIAGEQFFYGLQFHVDERVLIPRPETELLVEHALGFLENTQSARVMDIGTGSGCIAVTMALRNASLVLDALDCSVEALAVARGNALAHKVQDRVRFHEADIFRDSFTAPFSAGTYSLIVSNPPYIPDAEWELLQREVREYEPRLALTTPTGMECYRAIAGHAGELLKPEGVLCFEVHAEGAAAVGAIMDSSGFSAITVTKDYSGLDRLVSGRLQA